MKKENTVDKQNWSIYCFDQSEVTKFILEIIPKFEELGFHQIVSTLDANSVSDERFNLISTYESNDEETTIQLYRKINTGEDDGFPNYKVYASGNNRRLDKIGAIINEFIDGINRSRVHIIQNLELNKRITELFTKKTLLIFTVFASLFTAFLNSFSIILKNIPPPSFTFQILNEIYGLAVEFIQFGALIFLLMYILLMGTLMTFYSYLILKRFWFDFARKVVPKQATTKYSKMYFALKRLSDIILSSIQILYISPVLLIISLAIKLSSRGPILFKTIALGKRNKEFMLYKFRTMHFPNAKMKKSIPVHDRKEVISDDGKQKKLFSIRDDPRITKVGRFLRRYSLDELPQFINVWNGDMSIVGPRPIIKSHFELLKFADEDIDSQNNWLEESKNELNTWFKYRHIYKPGILGTGTWEIHSQPYDVDLNYKIRMENNYCEKQSMIHDFIVMIKTVLLIMRG